MIGKVFNFYSKLPIKLTFLFSTLDLFPSKRQSSIENLYLHGCFTDIGFVNIYKCEKIKSLFIINEHFITTKSM